MNSISRGIKPDYLANFKIWGKEYAEKRKNLKKSQRDNFDWKVDYEVLLKDVSDLTLNHCSYCDLTGVRRGQTSPTIDHFRPKAKFPLLAYTWHNLFLCCTECQKRLHKFNKLLLKPDQINYDFNEYFMLNFITGDIEPNTTKAKEYQQRAKITITLFKLNDFDRGMYRLESWNSFQNHSNPHIDNFSYRFFILECLKITDSK